MAKKLKFGIYAIEASVEITDDVDLDEHFTAAEWDEISASDQISWIRGYIEDQAFADLSTNYKLTT